MEKQVLLMDENGINRAITRIAYEIIEKNKGTHNLIFMGIKTRGVLIANRLAEKVKSIEEVQVPVGILDTTLYRDDLRKKVSKPDGHNLACNNKDVNNKTVVLIDDVLYTGRTARAALDALVDMGRPKIVQLAVLVDRGHRELPIRADYVGKNAPTSRNEIVKVRLKEIDQDDCVVIEKIVKQP